MLTFEYTGCVYLATNRINGRAYIGKTIMPLCDRKAIHIHAARRKASRSAFHCAIRKYGADAFVWTKLFQHDDEPALFDAERRLIAEYRASGVKLYNLSSGGEGQSIPCSPERRAKVSEFMRTRKWTDEQRQRMSEARLGKPKNRESVEKMRATKTGQKGKPWNPERRARFMATWAKKYADGYKFSEERIERMKTAGRARAEREGIEVLRERGKIGAEKRWRG